MAATQEYNFTEFRDQSGTGSINKAFERMTDYLSNADGHNFLQFDAMQKYSNYWMVSGIIRERRAQILTFRLRRRNPTTTGPVQRF